MKIFVCASKHFYPKAEPIIKELCAAGHMVTPPNCFDDLGQENRMKDLSADEYIKWKASMFQESVRHAENNDAILVLNFEKELYWWRNIFGNIQSMGTREEDIFIQSNT